MRSGLLGRFFSFEDEATRETGWRSVPREEAAAMDELRRCLRGGATAIGPTNVTVTFSPGEIDAEGLGRAAVQIKCPLSISVTAFLRRATSAEESASSDAMPVRVEFGESGIAHELLDQAIAPKIRDAWEEHRRREVRSRGRVSSFRARVFSVFGGAPKKIQ